MSDKVRSQITEVVITDRTYDKEKFDPTLINFFFGKNGTGKSTVAAYLHDSPAASFTWDPAAAPDIKREIFNEDYITQNVQSYGNIPGVFTISESDARAQKELDDKFVELLAGKDPEEQTPEKLDALYHTVYGGEEKPKHEFYALLSQISIPQSDLTSEPIISHSDAPFAKFVQRLGNLDWVKAGHDQSHANAE